MQNEQPIFVSGMFFKNPHERAPQFVKGKISIKVSELIPFLQQHQVNDYVNINLKLSNKGMFYMVLDTWQPQAQQQPQYQQPQQPTVNYPQQTTHQPNGYQPPYQTPQPAQQPSQTQAPIQYNQFDIPDDQYPQPDDIQVENIPF